MGPAFPQRCWVWEHRTGTTLRGVNSGVDLLIDLKHHYVMIPCVGSFFHITFPNVPMLRCAVTVTPHMKEMRRDSNTTP